MGPETARRAAAFTLIEMLAVVALMGLMAAFVVPNLGSLQNRRLHAQARELAAQFELARQRSVVTGIPHRMWMDLERRSSIRIHLFRNSKWAGPG